MISLSSPAFLALNLDNQAQSNQDNYSLDFSDHQEWNHESGWKNTLNNFRLVIQPVIIFGLIYPWLEIFPSSNLFLGFNHLIEAMNQFKPFYSSG